MDEQTLKERLHEYRRENKKLRIALLDLLAYCEMSPIEQAAKIKYYTNAKELMKNETP